ncbi:MAG: exodeoxyribonuclease VII small subunit [Microthrixaceae bacterium]
MSTKATPPEELGFTAAMAELDQIVASLESDALDVDALADQVSRAAELVDWCRTKLDATRYKVEKIVTRLDSSGSADPAE